MTVKGRVFIVDDNPYSADLLESLLSSNGYAVEKAMSGRQALSAIPTAEPDLVLLDVRLPDIEGFQLADALRRDIRTRDLPIVFMSNQDDVDSRIKGLEQGATDHIARPFEPREVLARVERQVTVARVRRALRESEAKFRSVMESAIDAIISADARGVIRSWNQAATDIFGYLAEEAVGRPLEIIIPERYREPHRRGIERVSSGGPGRVIGSTVELSGLRKDGTELPIELSLATWTLDDQRYFTGIIRDITERKEAEQKFRSVTESAIDAIISADADGRIVGWNSAATRILGYTAEQAVGRPVEIIIPQRFHQAHRSGMDRVTRGGKSRVIGRTVELNARTKSGEEIPIELSLSTWTVHDERYYTGIIRDISGRKRAERQLRSYTETLARQHEELALAQVQLVEQEKQAMLGRLVAGILHEINTPVGALRSAADSFARVLERFREYVTERAEAAEADDRSGSAVLRTLDFGEEMLRVLVTSTGRVESVVGGLGGFVSLDGSEVRLHDVREGIQGALSLLAPQLGQRIRVTTRLPEGPATVYADPGRLNQAFLNLLENAIEAIDSEGEIHVSVEENGPRLELIFADTGRGMSPDELASAFEFGFTQKKGRVRLRLGLTTSRRAVEAAGGELTLESTPGIGTKARIVLPRVTAGGAVDAGEPHPATTEQPSFESGPV